MSSLNSSMNRFFGLLSKNSSVPLVKWIIQVLALTQSLAPAGWPRNHRLAEGERFDFIVVGAGSAGAALAARLAEAPWRVLLLEAGGDPPDLSVVPSMFPFLAHSEYDWDYIGYLDPDLGEAHVNEEVFLTRGKMLGGSSSLNYEIYSRGVADDFERWGQVSPGWNWDTVLQYYKKMEGMDDSSLMDSKYAHMHSKDGPLNISRPKPTDYFSQMNEVYLQSYEEMGFPRVMEINGLDIGVSLPHFTFANGRRSSTAECYLKPNKDRPNLYVAKYAHVNRLLIEPLSATAYGVEVRLKHGKVINVYAEKEVILSAGAYNTPKIMMLSGIGPRDELERIGIEPIVDLPVGLNMQDHVIVPLFFSAKEGLETALNNINTMSELKAYPVPMQVGFFSLNETKEDVKYTSASTPSFQFFNLHVGSMVPLLSYYGCRSITNLDEKMCTSLGRVNALRESDVTALILLHPLSLGQVKLRSSNPKENPEVELGFFRDDRDAIAMAKAAKFLSRLVNTTYYRSVNGELSRLKVADCDEHEFASYQYWYCYVRSTVSSMMHPSGTCRMGRDGVVDEELQVHGVLGLRVADASVMPEITSGNTNAPCIMIGERAADLIKQKYLLSDDLDV